MSKDSNQMGSVWRFNSTETVANQAKASSKLASKTYSTTYVIQLHPLVWDRVSLITKYDDQYKKLKYTLTIPLKTRKKQSSQRRKSKKQIKIPVFSQIIRWRGWRFQLLSLKKLLQSSKTSSPCSSWPSTFQTRQPQHRSNRLNLILLLKQYAEMDLRMGTKPWILDQESNRRDQLASNSSHTTSLRTLRNKIIAILWTSSRHQTFNLLPGWSLNRVQISAKPAILKQIKTSIRRTWK